MKNTAYFTNRTRRRTIRIRIIIGILLLVSPLFLTSCNQPEQSGELTKVTICQWGQALIYLPLYIAQQEGYFEDEGLDITIIDGGSDDLTWAAVTSGNAQFGIADPTMIAIQAAQGGVPGRIIGDIVGRVSFWAVTLDTSMAKIESPIDFKGQTVAAFRFPNTAHALALRTFQKGGLELGKDVDIVPVDYGAVLAQLLRKEATLAMVLEPAASIAESEGAKVVYSYPKDWGKFAFTGLTTTEAFIREDPETVQKVVNALERAMRLAHADLPAAVDNGAKAFPELNRAIIERAVRRMLDEGTLPEHITPSLEGWNNAIDVNIEVGKLETAPDPSTMIDDSFAIKAVEQIGPMVSPTQ